MAIDLNKIDWSQLAIEKVELISFLAGIKPTLFYLVEDFELSKSIIQEICGGKKLYFGELGPEKLGDAFRLAKNGIIQNKKSKQKYLIVSRHKNVPEKLINSYLNYEFEKVGKLLGYPPCCAKYFSKIPDKRSQSVQSIFRNTRGRPVYYVNSIYNFSARLHAEDSRDVKKIGEKNSKSEGHSFYLIPYHPCSFCCKKSIEIGKKTLFAFRELDPRNAEIFEAILKKPILFLDKFHWITFNGFVKQNNIFYQSISPPFSLVGDEILAKIKAGSRLALKKGRVVVFDNNYIVGRLNFKRFDPIILDFNNEE